MHSKMQALVNWLWQSSENELGWRKRLTEEESCRASSAGIVKLIKVEDL